MENMEKKASLFSEKRIDLWLVEYISRYMSMFDDEYPELKKNVGRKNQFKDIFIDIIKNKNLAKGDDPVNVYEKYRRDISKALIPLDALEWIDSERALSFVANCIHAEYKLYINEGKPSLLDIVMPDWSLSTDGSGVNYEGLILLIDYQCRVSSLNHMHSLLEYKKKSWVRLQNIFDKPFWFPSDKYDKKYYRDYEWVLSYFEKNGMIKENVDIWYRKNISLKIYSVFDQWAENKSDSEVELFIIKLKKAWNQKKFRDGVSNKKVLNTYISKESKRELDYLIDNNDIKINEMIEILIHEAYTKKKLKNWER
ncbi:hypothetical protein [Dickeya chrysanthemi]|uniref:hypothetical protein n=1 Tax=Dickeya chrysanthemi TaxID=556 RepID=UPI00301823B1